jgi:hypothetical protein
VIRCEIYDWEFYETEIIAEYDTESLDSYSEIGSSEFEIDFFGYDCPAWL